MRGSDNLEMESGKSSQENVYINLGNPVVQRMKNGPKAKDIPAAGSTQYRVMVALGVLLILAFLIVVILTSLLFINYKSLSGEQSDLGTHVLKLSSRLQAYKPERSSNFNYVQTILESMGKLAEKIQKVDNSAPPLCRTGWTLYGLSCYFESTTYRPWTSAKNECESWGAHLVVINGEIEMSFLQRFVQSDFLWIGLAEKDGTWAWVDGTSYQSTPMFWQEDEHLDWSGHSDTEREDCAQLMYRYHWDKHNCSSRFKYICEKKYL